MRAQLIHWGMGMAVCGALAAAEVKGRVTLEGKPPPEIKIEFDALCAKLHKEGATTRHYVVSPEGGLANVFVYLKQGPVGRRFAAPAETPLLDQVDCFFVPPVFGVLTNQKFRIKNSDPLMHNVHAEPKVKGNKEFNIGQPVQNMVTEKSFAVPEVFIRIRCDIHPWMFAYAGVLDHPYFAVTDREGRFKLPADLPAGKYTVVARHVKAGEASREITVTEGGENVVNFTLQVPLRK
ncbi:MAG TPA: carboxypeptidase regulatory-like domain-containing protein [Verrucomicrobiota bacterium]|nr:carboxypeptidase regulatory-like domain-containing protein [Verrucomicrobiota bacterium]HNU49959.1 carboxypeptidase regulatory-like domain-containing protein [Verrucomicrobiota bacterium]